jgi:hypothetical protein
MFLCHLTPTLSPILAEREVGKGQNKKAGRVGETHH